MAECCDSQSAQSHLSSKATAFSIASLMASDENGSFNILLLLFLFISYHASLPKLLFAKTSSRSNRFEAFRAYLLN